MIKRISAGANSSSLNHLKSNIFKQVQEQLEGNEISIGDEIYDIKNLATSIIIKDGIMSFTFMNVPVTLTGEIFPIHNMAFFKTKLIHSKQNIVFVTNLVFKLIESDEIKGEYDFYFADSETGVTDEERKDKNRWGNTYVKKLVKHFAIMESKMIEHYDHLPSLYTA